MAQRNTQQRQAIQRALDQAQRPLDAQEVLAAAQHWLPSLGLATVYRTLKDGAQAGWLSPVELPGGATRYELADKPHHHHFECRLCHRVFDVAGCPGPPEAIEDLTPKGFTLEDHEVVLYGLCDQCAS